MAGYAILGEGEVSKKYLLDTLKSLQAKAEKAGEEFFLILPYELTVEDGDDMVLTDAMADIYEWVEDSNIWARVFAAKDEPENEQPTVEEFKVVGKKESVAQAIVKDIVNEGGELLVITHTQDWDEVDDRDAEAVTAIEAANQNGVTVRQLNNGMIELDLTESENEPGDSGEGPDEDDVRGYGEAADGGDEEAAAELTKLAEEYGFDLAEEPYASMSWAEFAEALLTADAEQANAEVEQAPEEVSPQAHDRAELERKQVRSLRSMAIAEGWGRQGQGFPKWFLVKHLAEGTVPTKAQLDGKEQVPDEDPDAGTEKAPRGRRSGGKGPTGAPTPGGFLLAAAEALEAAGQAFRAYVSMQ